MIQIAMRMLVSPKGLKCNSNCDTSNQLSATRKSFSIYPELDGFRYILYMYTTVFLNKHVLYALLNISYYEVTMVMYTGVLLQFGANF